MSRAFFCTVHNIRSMSTASSQVGRGSRCTHDRTQRLRGEQGVQCRPVAADAVLEQAGGVPRRRSGAVRPPCRLSQPTSTRGVANSKIVRVQGACESDVPHRSGRIAVTVGR